MSATDELRRMLDERGVEWLDSSDENVFHTTWNAMSCWFNEFPDGWTAWGMAMRGTPEQAIAATLGNEPKSMRVFDSMETALAIAEKEVEIEELKRENAELCSENTELAHRRAELEAATLGGNGKSRWHELFGTPERAARTLGRIGHFKPCDEGQTWDCAQCPFDSFDCGGTETPIDDDCAALLEWLRGDAE